MKKYTICTVYITICIVYITICTVYITICTVYQGVRRQEIIEGATLSNNYVMKMS